MALRSLAVVLLALAGCSTPRPDDTLTGAARSGNLAALQAHLRKGADVNARSGVNGWTPLEHAIHRGQLEAVRALIRAGAEVNRSAPNGMTPLIMAAGYGHEEMVRELLKAGADPRQRFDGVSALDRAVAGTPDLDRFTVFTCQTGTVRALREAAPDLKYTPHGPDRLTYSWTRKHCPEIMALLDTSRAAAK